MIYNIDTRIIIDGDLKSRALCNYDSNAALNVTDLKALIKSKLPESKLTVSKEIIYIGNDEMKNNEIIQFVTGIEYDIYYVSGSSGTSGTAGTAGTSGSSVTSGLKGYKFKY